MGRKLYFILFFWVAKLRTSGSQPGVREIQVLSRFEQYLLLKLLRGYASFNFYVWGYVSTKRLRTNVQEQYLLYSDYVLIII